MHLYGGNTVYMSVLCNTFRACVAVRIESFIRMGPAAFGSTQRRWMFFPHSNRWGGFR